MDYKSSTGKSIEQAFKEFHRDNPRVYEAFKQQIIRALLAKKKKLSSKAIINYLRWEMFIKTKSHDGFKINDAFTPYYARLFMQQHPQYKGLFETRGLRSV